MYVNVNISVFKIHHIVYLKKNTIPAKPMMVHWLGVADTTHVTQNIILYQNGHIISKH